MGQCQSTSGKKDRRAVKPPPAKKDEAQRVKTVTLVTKPGDRVGVHLKSEKGTVKLHNIVEGTPAAESGLLECLGWEITAINGCKVCTVSDVAAELEKDATNVITLRPPRRSREAADLGGPPGELWVRCAQTTELDGDYKLAGMRDGYPVWATSHGQEIAMQDGAWRIAVTGNSRLHSATLRSDGLYGFPQTVTKWMLFTPEAHHTVVERHDCPAKKAKTFIVTSADVTATPPRVSHVVRLRLNTLYAAFDQEDFHRTVCDSMGLEDNQVALVSIRKGSVIVRMRFCDVDDPSALASSAVDTVNGPLRQLPILTAHIEDGYDALCNIRREERRYEVASLMASGVDKVLLRRVFERLALHAARHRLADAKAAQHRKVAEALLSRTRQTLLWGGWRALERWREHSRGVQQQVKKKPLPVSAFVEPPVTTLQKEVSNAAPAQHSNGTERTQHTTVMWHTESALAEGCGTPTRRKEEKWPWHPFPVPWKDLDAMDDDMLRARLGFAPPRAPSSDLLDRLAHGVHGVCTSEHVRGCIAAIDSRVRARLSGCHGDPLLAPYGTDWALSRFTSGSAVPLASPHPHVAASLHRWMVHPVLEETLRVVDMALPHRLHAKAELSSPHCTAYGRVDYVLKSPKGHPVLPIAYTQGVPNPASATLWGQVVVVKQTMEAAYKMECTAYGVLTNGATWVVYSLEGTSPSTTRELTWFNDSKLITSILISLFAAHICYA